MFFQKALLKPNCWPVGPNKCVCAGSECTCCHTQVGLKRFSTITAGCFAPCPSKMTMTTGSGQTPTMCTRFKPPRCSSLRHHMMSARSTPCQSWPVWSCPIQWRGPGRTQKCKTSPRNDAAFRGEIPPHSSNVRGGLGGCGTWCRRYTKLLPVHGFVRASRGGGHDLLLTRPAPAMTKDSSC